MEGLGKRLREKARILGLSDSEVARRLGLSQTRYHNYVSDITEPDLATLLRICRVLGTSPDEVLAFGDVPAPWSETDLAGRKLASAMSGMDGEDLVHTTDLLEAIVAVRLRKVRDGRDGGSSEGNTAEG